MLLLQKDIKGGLLADGLKMNEFRTGLRLARNKAENVVDKLNELSVLYSEESELLIMVHLKVRTTVRMK